MTWRKYFKSPNMNFSPISGNHDSTLANPAYRKYQSTLPDVYIGHPNRIERYNQYEAMDMDSEVNAALDIIAEFSTQSDTDNNLPFKLHFKGKPTDNEVKIINDQLNQWCSINEFNRRIFKIFRNVIKYGDQVFIRDPETYKLYWTEMANITKVIVNEAKGKEPEQYIVKDLGFNLQNLSATALPVTDSFYNHPQMGGVSGGGNYSQPNGAYTGGSRFSKSQNEVAVDAEHCLHISLTEGLDIFWPFGISVLENVYKVFKQKELLEDSIIIYRVQRAPERRIFKIDVGSIPSHLAMAHVERIKNEIHQRRIPSQSGSNQNMMDASYSPLAMNEDFFFPTTADGRGSSVEVLPGGQNLGEITDLHFFTNKLFRGLRIPASYLPTGLDDGTQGGFSDGKVGTALIQEWRFNQYCMRLQKLISEKLDTEFKMFMKWRGINIDGQLFELRFNEPQNFAQYRQAEVDSARIATFTQLEQYPFLSKRFLMTRFLGLSEAEMNENERLFNEENMTSDDAPPDQIGLRNVGVTPGGIQGDMDTFAPPMDGMGDDMGGELGGDLGGDLGGVGSPMGNDMGGGTPPPTI